MGQTRSMQVSRETVALYVEVALDDMERALGRFDDATVNARPFGPGTNSAAGLVTHACAAARFWFEHIGLDRPTDRDRDSEFTATSTTAELRTLIADTRSRLAEAVAAFDAGPTAVDHELRVFAPGGDTSDGSVMLHALQELFQHLGHLEVTADAVGTPPG